MIRPAACLLSAFAALCACAARPSVTTPLAKPAPTGEPTAREVSEAQAEARSASELLLTAKLLTGEDELPSRDNFPATSFIGPVACNVVMNADRGSTVPFRLRIEEPPFVHVRSTMFRVVVPETHAAPRSFSFTVDASAFVLHGAVHPPDVALHPALPIELGGIVVLAPDATLTLVGPDETDRVNVAYELSPDDALTLPRRTLKKQVACGDITLDPHAFSNHDGLERSSLGSVVLPAGTGLARVPGAAPFARVALGHEIVAVVVGDSASYLRVAVRRETDTVFGFVSKASTRTSDIGA
ncbi:MAG TPA: hypothetical protein VF103_11420, partial [Polyangiaceae bacterium]